MQPLLLSLKQAMMINMIIISVNINSLFIKCHHFISVMVAPSVFEEWDKKVPVPLV